MNFSSVRNLIKLVQKEHYPGGKTQHNFFFSLSSKKSYNHIQFT